MTKGFNLALGFGVKLLKKSGWVGGTAPSAIRNLYNSELGVCQPVNTGPAHPAAYIKFSSIFSRAVLGSWVFMLHLDIKKHRSMARGGQAVQLQNYIQLSSDLKLFFCWVSDFSKSCQICLALQLERQSLSLYRFLFSSNLSYVKCTKILKRRNRRSLVQCFW